jgi:hypothetical protein
MQRYVFLSMLVGNAQTLSYLLIVDQCGSKLSTEEFVTRWQPTCRLASYLSHGSAVRHMAPTAPPSTPGGAPSQPAVLG